MSKYGFIFYVLLQFLSVISQSKVIKITERPSRQDPSCGPKYNAILFLADPTDPDCNVAKRFANTDNYSGLDFLKLKEKCRIKHCTSGLESKIGDTFDSVMRYNRETCKCEELLKTSLLSLITFSRDTLGMATALASVTNNSFTSDVRFRNAETHEESHMPDENESCQKPEEQKEQKPASLLISAKNVTVRESQEDEPQLKEINSKENDLFPFFEIFNPRRKMKFNDINRWHKEEKKRSKLDVITEPEHTETFKIRSKRQVLKTDNEEVIVAKEDKDKNVWDFLNLIENIRESFYKNLMDDPDKLEEESIDSRSIGSVNEISMFDVVKKTFTAVTENKDSGFLLVVLGGRLVDQANPYSQLMQSLKYVIENTDESNTLVVLTGSCPKVPSKQETVQIGGKPQKPARKLIPVFARGCSAETFSQSQELYDVPMAIKKWLEEKYKTSGNQLAKYRSNENDDSEEDEEEKPQPKGQPLGRAAASGSELVRNKRSLLGDLKRNAQRLNEANILQVFLSYSLIAALFVFCF